MWSSQPIILSLAALAGGCKQEPTQNPTAAPQAPDAAGAVAGATPGATPSAGDRLRPATFRPLRYADVTAEAGIRFHHNSGAFGKKYLPETMGAGAAFLDFDGDGWQDVLLVNSTDWPAHTGRGPRPRSTATTATARSRDVTRAAGWA